MTGKLWGGAFTSDIDAEFETFQSSFHFDKRLVSQDLAGSLAHVEMLTAQAILEPEDGRALQDGLRALQLEDRTGTLRLPSTAEDIHSAIEALLAERLGSVAGKMHTARSRNDQVATDVRLFAKEAMVQIGERLSALRDALVEAADLHLASRNGAPAIMPGYTHLQPAQPLHLSHWFLAYFEMLRRDADRFEDALRRTDECPLGAAALCGTSWPIDRFRTAAALGFARPMRNSLDAVASRDFAVDLLSASASLMLTLSRLSEDLILYSTAEFGFVAFPDALATGSSIMPQKKNPDLCELTRAKAGRLIGRMTGLMTVLKGLPTAYNKDLQEDKEALFDAVDTVLPLLSLWTKLIPSLTWHTDTMAARACAQFSTSTELADSLAQCGVPFREAHSAVGALIAHCLATKSEWTAVPPDLLASFHPLLDAGMVAAAASEQGIEARRSFGGSSAALIRGAIEKIRKERP